ncbi:hypothetical protein BXY80_1220 [Ichthyenterobacterium magnum]|uniref:Uncharacterized protein n=2 Tax=Ichthyenterobacterium magnum TaxID=1230530 RepID=A0A420DLH7_9FLAO|nr:hypothetical protein BXY80_1220 [Ichthyenterobacterium magnum]
MTSLSFAQSKGINYKALIKDSGGNVLANATITVEFNILQGAGMTSVYQESHTTTSGANGIIIVNIGEGTIISGNYNAIDWATDAHFLNVQMDSGAGLTDLGTTEFKAVPYALNAASKIDELSDGKSDNDGTDNGSSVFIGIRAGYNDNAADNKNIGVGYEALLNNTSGLQNSALGYQTLSNNLGFGNTGIGAFALSFNNIGSENVAVGSGALFNNIDGFNNTAIGTSSLFNNTTGNKNIGNGYRSLYSNTSGIQNTAVGNEALYNNITGSENTAYGYQALFNNTDGNRNFASGYKALFNINTGDFNTAIGYQSLFNSNEGSNNTAIGYRTLENNVSGTSNTAIGNNAGRDNIIGDGNVFIGSFAGAQETGSGKLYIENRSHDANGALIYGDFGINILRTNSEFQIGNPTLTGFAFPTADGSTNQVLQTDGNGTLTWADN